QGSGDRTFDVWFSRQLGAGTYTLRVGPDVQNILGEGMAAAYSTTYRLGSTSNVQTFTQPTRAAINPNQATVSLLTINQHFLIADLNVRLDITYPRVSDLYIHLQAPNGTDIVLFNRMGGDSANLSGTLLDDQATQYIGFGRGPFTGVWQP